MRARPGAGPEQPLQRVAGRAAGRRGEGPSHHPPTERAASGVAVATRGRRVAREACTLRTLCAIHPSSTAAQAMHSPGRIPLATRGGDGGTPPCVRPHPPSRRTSRGCALVSQRACAGVERKERREAQAALLVGLADAGAQTEDSQHGFSAWAGTARRPLVVSGCMRTMLRRWGRAPVVKVGRHRCWRPRTAGHQPQGADACLSRQGQGNQGSEGGAGTPGKTQRAAAGPAEKNHQPQEEKASGRGCRRTPGTRGPVVTASGAQRRSAHQTGRARSSRVASGAPRAAARRGAGLSHHPHDPRERARPAFVPGAGDTPARCGG